MPDITPPALAAAPNPFAEAAHRRFGSPALLQEAPSWYEVDPNSPLSSPRSTGTLQTTPSPTPLALPLPYTQLSRRNIDRMERLSPVQLGTLITVYVVMAARLEDWSLLRRLSRDLWIASTRRAEDGKWNSPASVAVRIGLMLDAVEGVE